MHQVPELGFDPHACARTRPIRLTGDGGVKSPCAVPRADVEARQRPYREALAPILAAHPNVRVVDPMEFLCDETLCYGKIGEVIVYRDDDHLSVEGSRFVAERLGF